MTSLTDRQRAVLDMITAYIREHGMSPTLNEIAIECDLKSPQAAKVHVTALVRKGAITVEKNARRGISINDMLS